MKYYIVNHDTEREEDRIDRVDFKHFCKKYNMMNEEKKVELKQLLKEQKWEQFKKFIGAK